MNALDGLRVVDVTHAVAGPSATKLLADLGADVVKIEPPGSGDFTRKLVPYCFEAVNRSKRSVVVDVKTDDGVEFLRRLTATADVFVQSQRPGFLESRGLGPDDLLEVKPDLIYASLSGFGTDGPSRDRRGIEATVQAVSGLAALQGRVLGNTSFVDQSAGLALHGAILAALVRRERFGLGSVVDVSLLDVAIYLQQAPLAEYTVSGHMHEQDEYAERFPTVGVFDAADGPVFMAAYWDNDWQALSDAFQRPEMLEDERLATADGRRANVELVQRLLGEEIGRRTRSELLDLLDRVDVIGAPLQSYADVLEDPQVRHREILESVETSTGTLAQFPRAPYRLDSVAPAARWPAPPLGRDTESVAAELSVATGPVDGP